MLLLFLFSLSAVLKNGCSLRITTPFLFCFVFAFIPYHSETKMGTNDIVKLCSAGGAGALLCYACMKRASTAHHADLSAPQNPVLRYWFYSDTQEKLHPGLWFCAEGSDKQRAADVFIHTHFAALHTQYATGSVLPDAQNPHSLLSAIILLDQMGRHLSRFNGTPSDAAAHHTKSDPRALEYTEALLALPSSRIVLTATELVFALLPLRHHKSDTETEKAYHVRALDMLANIEAKNAADVKVCERFRSATLRRYQALCDRRPIGEGILEKEAFAPSDAVMAGLPKETLVRSVAKFLHNREGFAAEGVACVSLSGGVDSMVIADIFRHLRDHPRPVERARKGQFKGVSDRRVKNNLLEEKTAGLVKKVVAVHIHYGNRAESKEEADFLREWCEERSIALVVKSIDDLRRGEMSRDEYEEQTRSIRFDEYRKVMREGVQGVCLGHHRGDVVENLLSNANRGMWHNINQPTNYPPTQTGSGLLELSGMSEVVQVEDVFTWRPLLLHDKTEIFDYAHKYGVPYFRDTTPSWSTRGKLRNNLMPCLQDTYGTGTEQNLHSLALESDSMKRMLYTTLVEPYIETLQKHPLGISLRTEGYTAHGRLFWREVFKTIQHRLFNTSMLSDAGMREVSLRLALTGFEDGDEKYVTGAQDGWLEPKKGMFWFLEEGVLYIPQPSLFGTVFTTAPPLVIGGGPASVGTWHVSAALRTLADGEEGDLRYSDHRSLPKPCRVVPFKAWDTFLSGHFSYCVAVAPETNELTWQNDGEKAPWCWKQMHAKWFATLPIACAPPLTSDDCKVVEISYRHNSIVG